MATPALLIFTALLSLNGGSAGAGAGSYTRHMFVFGDSFFDVGNNNYINTTAMEKADFWPYGESYFPHPTGRFSNGRLIPDFIAEHAFLPLIPPYLRPARNLDHFYHGVNFASAGAGALSLTFKGMVIDLQTQLHDYTREVVNINKRFGEEEGLRIRSKGVYMISIGTNDYISPFLVNSTTLISSYTPSHYVQMVIANLTFVLKKIYDSGGRKFVFLNLGDLGCFPGLRIPDLSCLEEASNLARLHNEELGKMLSQMGQNMDGFDYFVYDFNATLHQMTALPSEYGMKEGKKACCGSGELNGVFSCGGKRMVKDYEVCEDPTHYLFWDSYHLTQCAYKQMAHQMWSSYKLTKLFVA